MQDPELLWTAMAEFAAKIVPESKVELRFQERSAHKVSYPVIIPSLFLANKAQLVEEAIKCQQEGVNAVMMAPAIDPGLDEARALASIPVVGSLESGMAVSQFIGRRVGIIGVRAGYTTIIDNNVKRYGLRERLIDNRPVRFWEMDYKDVTRALLGDGSDFLGQFEQVGQELIEEGADVIVGGCQFFGAILNRVGYKWVMGNGVPFIDCGAAGLKMAESMAGLARSIGLKKSESPFSPFQSIDPALIQRSAKG
jgi:allantoin racemase